ncbi:LuxR C-terminal-related transcriptional regulator [Chloroflexi bacterium TSY]|nr:LuxR C-terminal-related transcriptional regulator [Chloroflexi bacterium TSY]
MPNPILQTKLYAPPPRPDLIQRPRLIDTLNQGLHRKLTLISAAAGFGKTTLTSEWVAACGRPTAWLSLDEGDNDLIRFLTYFVAAMQTILPKLGERVLTQLQSPQPPGTDALLTLLLNEIATVQDKLFLVLDDYHVLESPAIDEALIFLLDHLPSQMHLVITTREDPNLPLARYRVRGQLTEVRAADLRFTPAESAEFLNQVMGLNLSAEEITALETRTEGWIAGLQMAALALQGMLSGQGSQNAHEFLTAFAGDDRYIVDYLVAEVLQQQPEQVRNFLLQTAILERMCGPLCDAVTDQADGDAMLTTLEQSNLFVIPLDNKREWYRYHHLFADVLQLCARTEQPQDLPILHRRASLWYAENDLPSAAIHHALVAEDFERAADLIELARPAIERGRRDVTFRGWVEALPDELVRARPVLNVGYALALQDAGELEEAEARLTEVEQWLEAGANVDQEVPNLVVVDDGQFKSLPASIAIARVVHTLASGDISGTAKYAQVALDHIPEEDHHRRGQIIGLLGLAYWASGEVEAAQRAITEAGVLTQKAGTILDTIPGTFVVADIQVIRGQLREAGATYEQTLQLAAEHDAPTHLGIEKIYAGLSELYCERGDLDEAAQALATSKTLGERFGDHVWHHRWRVAQARLNATQGDWDSALEQLHKAEHLYILNPLSHVRPIAALKTQIWVKQGRLTSAEAWVRDRSLSTDDELSYAREFEHITLARLVIAQHQHNRDKNATRSGTIQEATELLVRLLKAAEAGGRFGSVIEILVLLTLAHAAQNDVAPALDALERALTLAEPEGYIRVFVNEGSPMAQLLRTAADRGIMPAYTDKLLAAFKAESQPNVDTVPLPNSPEPQPLIEPLSQRELDVLRLLQTELTGPEIADELVVALSTVRTHTKNIYGKLNVNNRRAAVKRAEELDLI